MRDRPLTQEETTSFAEYADSALYNLGFSGDQAEPEAIVVAVEAFVDQCQNDRRGIPKAQWPRKPNVIEVALSLGAVWGNQIVRRFGWEWTCVQDGAEEWYAVTSPDRSVVIYAAYFIKDCLTDPGTDCTIALAYNMLAAGKIPIFPAGGYESLMRGIRRIVPKG